MEEFKKEIASCFRIDNAELTEFNPYGSGHINETYRVVFKINGRDDVYIFQKINTHVFRNPDFLMENISRVLKHCETKLAGKPDQARRCIHLVPSRNGKMYHRRRRLLAGVSFHRRCRNLQYSGNGRAGLSGGQSFWRISDAAGRSSGGTAA